MIPSENETRTNAEVGRTDLRLEDSRHQQVVDARMKELHELGFSDDFIIDFRKETLVGANMTVKERLDQWVELGFSQPVRVLERQPSLLQYTNFELLRDRLDRLKELGFKNPIKLAERAPEVLKISGAKVQQNIFGLQELGFVDPIRTIETYPGAVVLDTNRIEEKIDALKELGFADPVRIMSSYPPLIATKIETVRTKLDGLHELGFSNPIRLATKFPPFLGSDIETLKTKLDALRDIGIKDPVKFAEVNPSVLGLATESINRKIRLFNKISDLFELELKPIEVIEAMPVILGAKNDKLIVLTRIVRNSIHTKEEIDTTIIRKILMASLEDVLLALEYIGHTQEKLPPTYSVQDLVVRAKELKKQGLLKETKRQILGTSESIDPKIQKRYFKGYPMKVKDE